jgi:hypothetical protein
MRRWRSNNEGQTTGIGDASLVFERNEHDAFGGSGRGSAAPLPPPVLRRHGSGAGATRLSRRETRNRTMRVVL